MNVNEKIKNIADKLTEKKDIKLICMVESFIEGYMKADADK